MAITSTTSLILSPGFLNTLGTLRDNLLIFDHIRRLRNGSASPRAASSTVGKKTIDAGSGV
jgi:hypothetical protein